MSFVSPPGKVALLIVRQSALAAVGVKELRPAAHNVLAAANGMAPDGAGPLAQARGKIAESLFDRRAVDVNEMKVNLYERLGKEFGLDLEDFDDVRQFGREIRRAVEELKRQEGGFQVLARIERDLGLDKLGISIDTLIDAMIEPGGDADEKLEAALVRQLKEEDEKILEKMGALMRGGYEF